MPLLLLAFFIVAQNNALAAASLPKGISLSELTQKYNDRKFRILIVPGHDDDALSGGTSFGALKEADLNLQLAKKLAGFFRGDSHFIVFLSRDDSGYSPVLQDYFANQGPEIAVFRDNAKTLIQTLTAQNLFTSTTTVLHNDASSEEAYRLYGINAWASGNDIDLTVHVHFNDYPGRVWNKPGNYSGVSMYIPEKQFPNHEASLALAQSLFSQLTRYFHPSTNPVEKDGIIEDQDLIAIGTHASLRNPALLIECSYLYESPLSASATIRRPLLNEMAYQTYRGVKLYFEPDAEAFLRPSSFLPRQWKTIPRSNAKHNVEVLALQIALAEEHFYPSPNFNPNDCLLTGNFGPCTKAALRSFQQKNDLPATGVVGPLTLLQLNASYNYKVPQSANNFKYVWKTDLAYGLKNNADVAALQNALLLEKFYTGRITGNFSPDTRDALRAFQKSKGLGNIPPAGFVGPHTRKILNDLYAT
jgi:peptidoglycan hydrolase-like protein with peptidoglycan-binding domain